MDWSTIEGLRGAGFEGFATVESLLDDGCAKVPPSPGVYLVVRPDGCSPVTYRDESNGGHFKQRNPSVGVGFLDANWVEDAVVLYIGQAGGAGSSETLRKRIRTLVRFSSGEALAHWGGRLLWQLDGSEALLVCWRAQYDVDARAQEGALIADFKRHHGGMRPFANLRD